MKTIPHAVTVFGAGPKANDCREQGKDISGDSKFSASSSQSLNTRALSLHTLSSPQINNHEPVKLQES